MAGPGAAAAFGAVLRGRRTAALLTQEQLAERAGLSVRTVRDLERGRVRYPRRGSLRLIAEVLGLTGAELDEFEAMGRRDYWAERAAAVQLGAAGKPAPSPAVPAVPAQLPADVAGFTGRSDTVRALDDLLDAGDPAAVNIILLSGSPGVGKTALAVHWAHRVRPAFPGGQLYLNLLGHSDGSPLSPMESLTRLLRGLGVAPDRVPTDVAEAAALFRSLLADTRTLLLLDDAGHADQVRPLLPGGPGCVVLVTSRTSLRGLIARNGASHLTLRTLAPDDSYALLARLLGPERAAIEPAAITDLGRLCGHLPLALRIAAANIVGQDGHSVTAFTERLRNGNRLAELAVPADPYAMVRAAFDLSYDALPAEARRLFRVLAVAPGRDVTAGTAAALLGSSRAAGAELLEQLAGAHLVEQPVPGRFGQADLLRLYAAEQLGAAVPAERAASWERLLGHYLATLDEAAQLLYADAVRLPAAVPRAEPTFTDHREALAWIDAELSSLQATVLAAASSGPLWAAWQVADTLRGYFHMRGAALPWRTIAAAGLAAAEEADDVAAQAACHLSFAGMYTRQDRYADAIGHAERALVLATAAGRIECAVAAHRMLGNLCRLTGHSDDAAAHLQQALALADPSDRPGAASIINNIAIVNHELGRLGEAAVHYAHALELLAEERSPTATAQLRTDLGDVLNGLGRHDEALQHLEAALDAHRELADRGQEAYNLRCQAEVHRDAGRWESALRFAENAAEIAGRIDDVRLQAQAVETVGSVLVAAGRSDEAWPHLVVALELATATGNRYAQAQTFIGMSAAHLDRGQGTQACAAAETAVDLARHGGYRLVEGQALTAAAWAELHRGRPEAALDRARAAIEAHEMTGYVRGLGQAQRALEVAVVRSRVGS